MNANYIIDIGSSNGIRISEETSPTSPHFDPKVILKVDGETLVLESEEAERIAAVLARAAAATKPSRGEPERTYTKGEQEVAAMILGFRDFVRSIKSDFAGGSELAEKLEAEAKGGRK